MGFTFCVEGVERLFIQTLQGSVEVDVKDALERTQHHAVGGASKRMRIEAAPRLDGKRQAEMRWRAEELVPDNAYWVRVIQVDGERAWSQPDLCAASSRHISFYTPSCLPKNRGIGHHCSSAAVCGAGVYDCRWCGGPKNSLCAVGASTESAGFSCVFSQRQLRRTSNATTP